MHVRFWGTRGSIPAPGHRTTIYGGNTCCVEIRTRDGTNLILDCGTGIRLLGLDMLNRPGPYRIHLLIGHTHWDHIQGFPFFTPAFLSSSELNIYGSSAFQRSLEDSLAGQMQYSYFPVKLQDVAGRIHFTELEEGFFRIGDVMVETQYLNHTAPTIGFRISADGATIAYVTDHEPFWNAPVPARHPGDQRHIDFLRGADLVIHDAQYTSEEYQSKSGWGHSPADYVTDVAMAAGVSRVALFHHDPLHDDATIQQIEETQRARARRAGSRLEVFAAAEGMAFDLLGRSSVKTIVDVSALELRPITGRRVLLVTPHDRDIAAVEQTLLEDGLLITSVGDGRTAMEMAQSNSPDLLILNSKLPDGDAATFIDPLRGVLQKPDLPVIVLSEDSSETSATFEGIAIDYLSRPFSPPMLRTRIRAWLARSVGATATPVRVVVPPQDLPPADIDIATAGENTFALLSSIPLFSPLTAEQRARLLARSIEQTFAGEPTIIRGDDPVGMVYVILSGHVRVFEPVPATSIEMFLGELGPGEIFGESAVLSDRPRSASVVTLERTRCLMIPAADFLHMLGESREMSLALLRMLAARLCNADRMLARHAPDPLTGLPGRRVFHEMYRRLIAASRRRGTTVLLLVLDIVHMKEINDRYGYAVGDDVLRTVADALRESSRNTDLVTRHGSDEFTVLLAGAAAKDADSIMERVQRKLSQLARYRNLPLSVECRMGCAFSQNPPDTPEEFLRMADEDLQSKTSTSSK
jgi:diguanylate cyclase (GGDEF)-like protein